MTMLNGFSRRGFLAGISAVAVLAVAGSQAAAATSDPYAQSTWESLVGQQVRIAGSQARVSRVEAGRHGGFQVLFEEAGEGGLFEGLHPVTDPGIGTVDLFMVVHGKSALAIFN